MLFSSALSLPAINKEIISHLCFHTNLTRIARVETTEPTQILCVEGFESRDVNLTLEFVTDKS